MVAVAVVARRITQEQYKDITGENPTVEDVAHKTQIKRRNKIKKSGAERPFFVFLERQVRLCSPKHTEPNTMENDTQ